MNTKILQKCVDELKKDTPNIAYILGTLETLIEMSGSESLVPISVNIKESPTLREAVERADEELSPLAKAYVTGPIGKITIPS